MIKRENGFGFKVQKLLTNNIVTVIFAVFVTVGFLASPAITTSGLLNEVMSRFFRNGLLVVALIIPVMAGLGLNFGIVIGALAAVVAIIPVRYLATVPVEEMSSFSAFLHSFLNFGGISGLLLCFLIALPLALFFGYLTGKLYNRTRGQEMIAGIIVSFFAEGLLLIFVLFVIGGIIPVAAAHPMIIPRAVDGVPVPGVGVRMAFEMGLHQDHPIAARNPDHVPGLANALDFIWQIPFATGLLVLAIGVFAFIVVRRNMAKKNPAIIMLSKQAFILRCVICGVLALLALQALLFPRGMFGLPASPLNSVNRIPVVTGLVIAAFCLFTLYFTRTKLGQDCRSVGQNQHISNAAGINVDRTRIIATMISTVLGAWGMIVFLQNMGHVNTYNAHRQIGMFSVAALLVGGATAAKAGIKNAMLGLLLFHAMFVVSPGIGRLIFGDELVAEAVRSFMVYGVIGLALGLHAWKTLKAARDKNRLEDVE
jgi:simple sugar transport system permease protein